MSGPTVLKQAPQFSETEWQARVELAALYRLCTHYGWTDLTATHISARLADQPGHYLMNTPDMLFDEITASNLSKYTFAGERVDDGTERPINLAGHLIHSSVLNARPDVMFVVHTHTRAGTAVSCMPQGLMPLTQHAAFMLAVTRRHAYHDSTAVDDEGAWLARDLGDGYALLLENHGLLTVGRSAAEAFIYMYYLEMACKMQVDVLSCTSEPVLMSEGALKSLGDWAAPERAIQGERDWPALIRLLDRTQPDFRD